MIRRALEAFGDVHITITNVHITMSPWYLLFHSKNDFWDANIILCTRSVVSALSFEKWFLRRKYHFVPQSRGIYSFTRKNDFWEANIILCPLLMWPSLGCTFTRKMMFETQISFCAPVPWYLDFHSKNDFWDANIILCPRSVVSALSLEKWFLRRKYHFVPPNRGICSFTRKIIFETQI